MIFYARGNLIRCLKSKTVESAHQENETPFPLLRAGSGHETIVQVKMEERRWVGEKVGPCVVIRLISENKENRINPRFFEEYNSALDQAEK